VFVQAPVERAYLEECRVENPSLANRRL